ncbi:hypothetical protein INS49_009144 [Diaporthe citri]|uniref:uncharacterized protein n=1 Tax=Diaporthe citri TaxID=83186 RepID=UPI001C803C1E|nr:uncharacterized protein INS49_009144 [Diaporthe citri]KAG6364041.1 hypothetical protein INS49_009144 [Diaporthe citri]
MQISLISLLATGASLASAAAIAPPASNATGCTSLSTRIEWRNYSDSDREAFVDAIVCLAKKPSAGEHFAPSKSRWEDITNTHQILTHAIHGNEIFLPWHRAFVSTFEALLRNECGFDRALPWWDETLDAGKFNESSIFTPEDFGSLPQGRQRQILHHRRQTISAEITTDYIKRCAQVDQIRQFTGCLETGTHASGHNGIGAVMGDVWAAPEDPTPFMHHLFVDAQYASWQEGGSGTRKTAAGLAGGCYDWSYPCTSPLEMGSVLSLNDLVPTNLTLADVIDTRAGSLCYEYDYYF